jgi:hypothetical protein
MALRGIAVWCVRCRRKPARLLLRHRRLHAPGYVWHRHLLPCGVLPAHTVHGQVCVDTHQHLHLDRRLPVRARIIHDVSSTAPDVRKVPAPYELPARRHRAAHARDQPRRLAPWLRLAQSQVVPQPERVRRWRDAVRTLRCDEKPHLRAGPPWRLLRAVRRHGSHTVPVPLVVHRAH